MRLIGINGFKTSGKDSVYQVIAKEQPGVVRAAFADNLKIAAAEALGIEGNHIRCMDEAKENWLFRLCFADANEEQFDRFTGREYLQWFGQGMRKVFGDSFWVDQILPIPRMQMDSMHEEIRTKGEEESFFKSHYPDASVLCVTDVRYPNEAERIRQLGGRIWEVIRPGLESDGHSSEIPLARELVDRTIHNDGTLEDLAIAVKNTFHADAMVNV